MKILIQRVTQASVEVAGKNVGAIGSGALVFLGISVNDTINEVRWLANKFIHLRIFSDKDGKMNESLLQKKGQALIISQFTLYADCSAGCRPSFTKAAAFEYAKSLYEQFITEVSKEDIVVEAGIFGAQMQISLVNDGPVTFMLESPNN